MNTVSALQSGLSGFQTGINSLNQNTANIANSLPENDNHTITDSLVGLMRDKQQIQASIKVIESSQSMLGRILDIKA